MPDAAKADVLGEGCATSDGTVPVLRPAQGSGPWIADTFSLEMTSLPTTESSVSTFGVLGFSKTAWASFSLPQDLGFLGAPQCTQYVSVDFSFHLAPSGGQTLWHIVIPPIGELAGVEFYLQGVVVLGVAGPVQARVTNAIEAKVGAR